MYVVFVRTWWRRNKNWPGGLEPHAGRKRVIAHVTSEEEALNRCKHYNDMHEPGPLSRKAEFTEV